MNTLISASLGWVGTLALVGSLALAGCGTDGVGPGGPDRIERYLRADAADRVVIELDSVAGAEPRPGAEADLVARLETLLGRPGGVEIVHDDTIPSRGADYAWTDADVFALADETFDDDQPAGTVSMHVMWVDGRDADDSSEGATLGLAFSNRHIVMYHDTIEGSCRGGPIVGNEVCGEAQYLVWLHEVGHVIGLVDNGLAMVDDHRDPDRGHHDVDDSCVMYFAFEGRAGIDLLRERLLGASLPDFDDACLADVAAVRDAP